MELDEIVLAESKSIVKRLKRIAEEISGLRLNQLHINLSKRNCTYYMGYCPNEIIIYSKNWNCEATPQNIAVLECSIAHELGHHVNYVINPHMIKSNSRNKAITITIEGFAEYFLLDLFHKGFLLPKLINARKRELSNIKNNSSYGIGYRFFRKVTNSFGKKEAFHIIKRPNVKLYELETPLIYIVKRKIKKLTGQKWC